MCFLVKTQMGERMFWGVMGWGGIRRKGDGWGEVRRNGDGWGEVRRDEAEWGIMGWGRDQGAFLSGRDSGSIFCWPKRQMAERENEKGDVAP